MDVQEMPMRGGGSGRFTRIAPETGKARGFARPAMPTPPPPEDDDADLEPDEEAPADEPPLRRKPGRKPGEPQKKREPPRMPTPEERAAAERLERPRVIEATPSTVPRKKLNW